jgi:hypothetical protein
MPFREADAPAEIFERAARISDELEADADWLDGSSYLETVALERAAVYILRDLIEIARRPQASPQDTPAQAAPLQSGQV